MDADGDLDAPDRAALRAEAKRLRAALRAHRDSSGMDLCWYYPDLWNMLPERAGPQIAVPEWPQFLRGCVRYRQSLHEQAPGAVRAGEEYGQLGDSYVTVP
jgi:hypothetical protein